MARSDSHTPLWVRAYHAGYYIARHNCRRGKCDLPEYRAAALTYWADRGQCYWDIHPAFYRTPLAICGCTSVTCQIGRRQPARKVERRKPSKRRRALAWLSEE